MSRSNRSKEASELLNKCRGGEEKRKRSASILSGHFQCPALRAGKVSDLTPYSIWFASYLLF